MSIYEEPALARDTEVYVATFLRLLDALRAAASRTGDVGMDMELMRIADARAAQLVRDA